MLRSFLMFFIFFITNLFSSSFDNYQATIESSPSAIVDGIVNVVTGSLHINDTDLMAIGKEPLTFGKRYLNITSFDDGEKDVIRSNNAEKEEYKLSGWSFLNHTIAYVKVDHIDKRVDIYDSNGSVLRFSMPEKNKKGNSSIQVLKLRDSFSGFSTCGTVIKSAHQNYRNIKAELHDNGDLIVTLADGTVRKYIKDRCSKGDFCLREEFLKNGNIICYDHANHLNLTKIEAKSSKGNILSQLTFDHKHGDWKAKNIKEERGDKYDFAVQANTGKKVYYDFTNCRTLDMNSKCVGEYLFQLKEINFGNHKGYKESIDYYRNEKHTNPLLKNFITPNERAMFVDFYFRGNNPEVGIKLGDEDKKFQRVSALSVPSNGGKIITKKFYYDVGEPNKNGGKTTVFDHYDNKTVYHYCDKLRVQKIEKYKGRNTLNHVEKFTYGVNNTNEEGFYRAKMFCDGTNNHNIIKATRYDYDLQKRGNIEKETIFGNLTGKCKNFVSLSNNLPIETNVETYKKNCKYNNDDLLIREENENGLIIEYNYLPNTNLLSAKFLIFDNEIKQRYFYIYDDEFILIKEIIDDGKTYDVEDTKNITLRKIKKNIPRKVNSFYGLADTIEEGFYDLDSKTEKIIKQQKLHYLPSGKIERKDIKYPEDEIKYSLYYEYDEQGNLTYEKDQKGREASYEYDSNGNCTYKKDFSQKETYYEYDKCNRLIKTDILGFDKQKYSIKYQYDVNNNKTHEIDPRGNVTSFIYDAFGNVIEKRLPEVLDEKGHRIQKIFKYEYDELGRVIKKIDPKGYIKITSYNYYDKPTFIQYPNGSTEENVYNKDGTLNYHINQEKVITKYEYDYQARVISKRVYEPKENLEPDENFLGDPIQEEYFGYNAFNLISTKDSLGNITKYSYDFQGRKIKEELIDVKGKILEKNEYVYDSFGNISKQIFADRLILIYERDLLGRIEEERKEDIDGNVLYKIGYEYDKANNKTSIKTYVNNEEQKEYRYYDVFDRLIKIVDPLNNTENIYYNDYYNFFDQKTGFSQTVKQVISKNALGQKTVITYDALSREVKIEELRPSEGFEKTVSIEEKFYDLNDNLTSQVSTIFNPDGSSHIVITLWEYDSMNRLIKLVEAFEEDKNDLKITEYKYKKTGLLRKTIKPDGVKIKNIYDYLGNKVAIQSSDESINYKYTYNKLNQLVQIEDLNNLSNIQREYNARNNLLKESKRLYLSDKNSYQFFDIKHEYDLLGNKVKTIYPDKSIAEYIYDPIRLKKIIRKDKDENFLYEHIYKKYDLAGNITEEILANDKKHFCFQETTVDPLGRILNIQIDNDNFKQKIKGYDKIGRMQGIKTVGSCFEDDADFEYDDLNQIIQETGDFENSYSYDSHYNRLSKNDDKYEINDLNELISTKEDEFEYDKNGNLRVKKSNGIETHYFYDVLDRLIRTEILNKIIVTFTYDGLNRRVNKAVSEYRTDLLGYSKWVETKNEYTIYDDQNEIGTIDRNNNILELRILSDTDTAEIGSAISFELNGRTYVPIYDFSGSVVCLQSLDGKIFESYNYSCFGEKNIYDKNGSEIKSSYLKNPWQYLSKRLDEEIDLIFFGRRYYDPKIGRWITPDPKGFEDSLNLYAYDLNDPLINVDLYGLAIEKGNQFPDFRNTYNFNFNFDMNLNFNFESLWKKHLFMKLQYLQMNKDLEQKGFSQRSLDCYGITVSSGLQASGDFFGNFLQGRGEVYFRKEFAQPYNTAGAFGRIIGRKIAQIEGYLLQASGLIMIVSGSTGTVVGGALVFSGVGIIPGAAITGVSIGTVAVGIGLVAGGHVLHRNADKLSEIKQTNNNFKITISDSKVKHIFRDAKGHFSEDTLQNRTALEKVANDSKNYLGKDKFGNVWFSKGNSNNSQIWVKVRNNKIINGGKNMYPKKFNPKTGLDKFK